MCGADVAHLGDIVREIGHTALFLDPWDAPQPLARAWCLWELYHTVDCGARLDVVMSGEQRRRFRRALMLEDGDDGFESITRAVTSIDVERAETRKAKDRDMIMDAVRGSVGFYELNKLLMERMRAWVVEAARAEIAALPAAERGKEEGGRCGPVDHSLLLPSPVGMPAAAAPSAGPCHESISLWLQSVALARLSPPSLASPAPLAASAVPHSSASPRQPLALASRGRRCAGAAALTLTLPPGRWQR